MDKSKTLSKSGEGIAEDGGALPGYADGKGVRKESVVLEDEIFDERYESTKRGKVGGFVGFSLTAWGLRRSN
jgi:hypothetical protein